MASGRTCNIDIFVSPYTNPGTYNSKDNSLNVSLKCNDGTYWFAEGGIGAGTVTIRGDGKSGILNCTLQENGTGTVQMSGGWTPA